MSARTAVTEKLQLLGRKFNRLTVIEFAPRNQRGRKQYLCRCDCGRLILVVHRALISGNTNSCGCYHRDQTRKSNTGNLHGMKHGLVHSATYRCWFAMKQRCNNPQNIGYHNYGGRGIKVCDRWLDFRNFLADMGEVPAGLTLDRKDTDGNYEKSNCRWATRKEQGRNRRNNCLVDFRGEKLTIAELAELSGFHFSTIRYRVKRGMPIIIKGITNGNKDSV